MEERKKGKTQLEEDGGKKEIGGQPIFKAAIFKEEEKCGEAKGDKIGELIRLFARYSDYSRLSLYFRDDAATTFEKSEGNLLSGGRVSEATYTTNNEGEIRMNDLNGMLHLMKLFFSGQGELEFLMEGESPYSVGLFWEGGSLFSRVGCTRINCGGS